MPAIRVELSKDLHKRLKMRALQDDTTLQKLVPLALEAYLAQKAYIAQETQITKIKPKVTKSTKT